MFLFTIENAIFSLFGKTTPYLLLLAFHVAWCESRTNKVQRRLIVVIAGTAAREQARALKPVANG
jgi:hypothetical protein